MTVLQKLILEAGTALIVVLAIYALLPVFMIILSGEVPKKEPLRPSATSPVKGRQEGDDERTEEKE